MHATVLSTIIGSSGPILIAVVALMLNRQGFADLRAELNAPFLGSEKTVDVGLRAINARFTSVEQRLTRIEHRLDLLEADLKGCNKVLAQHDTDIARLKDKTGLS